MFKKNSDDDTLITDEDADLDTDEQDQDLDESESDNEDDSDADNEDDADPKVKKYKDLYQNQKARAEKAEKKLKESSDDTKTNKKVISKKADADISTKEMFSLLKADIAEEDFSEVLDFAKIKKISVSDALKSSTLTAILKDKAEVRESARAANMGNRRGGNQRVSDERLLEDARNGKYPESDADIDRLVSARMAAKKAARK